MPRIRTIKPDFWTDEKIVELSSWARLLYIGLWNFADDNGVVEHKPKQIKMRIFPADDLKIEPLIEELVTQNLIEIYEIDGDSFLLCPNLKKHQYIDSPRKSNLPLPHDSDIRKNHKKSEEILSGREGKGREKDGKGKGRDRKVTPPPDGDPQPAFTCPSFEVTQAHLALLVSRNPGFPQAYLLQEFLPKMADWCLDHRDDPQHRKKFDGAGRLKEPRRCLNNWLRKEDPDRALPYRRPKPPPPLPAEPPGMQRVHDPNCPKCRGGGRDRDGPCLCGHVEEIVYPDQNCQLCGGSGFTRTGVCTCLKPRKYGPEEKPAITAPSGQA